MLQSVIIHVEQVQEEVEKVDIIEHIKEPVLEEEHVVNEVHQMPNLGETSNKVGLTKYSKCYG